MRLKTNKPEASRYLSWAQSRPMHLPSRRDHCRSPTTKSPTTVMTGAMPTSQTTKRAKRSKRSKTWTSSSSLSRRRSGSPLRDLTRKSMSLWELLTKSWTLSGLLLEMSSTKLIRTLESEVGLPKLNQLRLLRPAKFMIQKLRSILVCQTWAKHWLKREFSLFRVRKNLKESSRLLKLGTLNQRKQFTTVTYSTEKEPP